MSLHSLRRQLEKLRATLPPPSPPLEEFPVEEWVGEQLREAIPEATLKNSPEEEAFFAWLEELPERLVGDLYVELNPAALLPEEMVMRVVDALPPHVERQRQLWADHFPAREYRRQFCAEMQKAYPRVRTRENGYGWWIDLQAEYTRLRGKYADFEEEWAAFYRSWEEKCEGVEGNSRMDGEMRAEFVGICFPGEPDLLAAFTPDFIEEFYEARDRIT